MSIHDYTQKIKSFTESPAGRDVAVVSIVVLTGLICFVLGRLSIGTEKGSGVVINGGANAIGTALVDPNRQLYNQNTYQSTNTQSLIVEDSNQTGMGSGLYVASSRGKRYYPVDCPAADGLSKKNLVYYNTAMDAEKAGKTLSASCN